MPAHKAISCAHLTRAFKEGDREGRNSVTVWKVPQFITYRYTVYNTDGTVRCVIELLIVSAPRKGRYTGWLPPKCPRWRRVSRWRSGHSPRDRFSSSPLG